MSIPAWSNGPARPEPARPKASSGDTAACIVLFILAGAYLVLCAFVGLFLLAFLDSCPPQKCSASDALSWVAGSLVAMAVVICSCTVWVVVRLRAGRLGWPLAVATVVLSCGISVLGFSGYFSAVGA